jgi:hypothetical protein
MLKTTIGDGGLPGFAATVSGVPIYLDNHSIIRLAKEDPSRRNRFIDALHNGADLLFSITNAAELAGPQGQSAEAIKNFLDEVGPHWFPVELDPYVAVQREAKGLSPSDVCMCSDLLRANFQMRTSENIAGSGKLIDLSENFFRLGAVMNSLAPHRETLLERTGS